VSIVAFLPEAFFCWGDRIEPLWRKAKIVFKVSALLLVAAGHGHDAQNLHNLASAALRTPAGGAPLARHLALRTVVRIVRDDLPPALALSVKTPSVAPGNSVLALVLDEDSRTHRRRFRGGPRLSLVVAAAAGALLVRRVAGARSGASSGCARVPSKTWTQEGSMYAAYIALSIVM
jgi:hypothetical protein